MVNHNKVWCVGVAIRNVPRFVSHRFLLEIIVLELIALEFIRGMEHWGTSTNDSAQCTSVPERIKQVKICIVGRRSN